MHRTNPSSLYDKYAKFGGIKTKNNVTNWKIMRNLRGIFTPSPLYNVQWRYDRYSIHKIDTIVRWGRSLHYVDAVWRELFFWRKYYTSKCYFSEFIHREMPEYITIM